MTVFEKIDRALKKIEKGKFAMKVLPVAAAAIIGVSATACYAAPPPREKPQPEETKNTPENSPENTAPVNNEVPSETVKPSDNTAPAQ
ncbi:MAG: hypothetical protein JXR95_02470 [Deltaproteobacteria bacterium]|nr:hypothetical protein [Deltaproteobacteria bacterium]